LSLRRAQAGRVGLGALRRASAWALAMSETLVVASNLYLLTLLVAASRRTEPLDARGLDVKPTHRLITLVPAHDEELMIAATVASLLGCHHAGAEQRLIVVADNCTDQTAARARAAGAEVWERDEPSERGKGFALAWAQERLRREEGHFDAVLVVDADCLVSPNLLSVIDVHLRDGVEAIQVDYVVANPEESAASALRHGAFSLANTVRYRGKHRLGLSCGIAGTGIAFSARLLERVPWMDFGLVEDAEHHMRLVLAGERVRFAPQAWVSSPMPTSHGGSGEQRWEQGRLTLLRRWTPRLVRAGIAQRDPVRLHAGLEWLVPPQSLLAALGLAAAGARLGVGPRRRSLVSAAGLIGQAVFVIGGLRLAGAPRSVYRALAGAPRMIVAKTLLYLRLLAGRGPKSWVRTERDGGT
jgi:cellulose synthase/poly-beta-1,6-N-acetylglucosamine synthase-like glycosyltransferase